MLTRILLAACGEGERWGSCLAAGVRRGVSAGSCLAGRVDLFRLPAAVPPSIERRAWHAEWHGRETGHNIGVGRPATTSGHNCFQGPLRKLFQPHTGTLSGF